MKIQCRIVCKCNSLKLRLLVFGDILKTNTGHLLEKYLQVIYMKVMYICKIFKAHKFSFQQTLKQTSGTPRFPNSLQVKVS